MNRKQKVNKTVLFLSLLTMTSCIKQIDLSETGEAPQDDYNQPGYIYPFKNEANQVVAQIILGRTEWKQSVLKRNEAND